MTIRRDLQRLDQQGVLQKVHGGAVLVNCLPKERPFGEKKLIQTQQKQTIAKKAMELVSAGDTILLDAGTTTFEMACLLQKTPGVHVVTSDLHIAVELCAAEGKLFFIGGEIEKELGRSTGAKALQFLSDIHVDTVFLGISSVSDELMLGSHSFENAELKRTFLKCGSKKVLLADKTKFGSKAFAQVGPLSLVDVLVTDKSFNEAEIRYLETHDIMLHEVR
jgi:DeoR/GlpR family transcriptional regulator of sugar metabolism